MLVKIYTLADPRDNKFRYVGKTRCALAKRLCEHCQDRRMRHNRHKINWIKKLESLGMRPSIHLLEECEEAGWQARERAWIAKLRSQLVNVDRGGNGSTWIGNRRIAESQRKSISETLKRFYRDHPEHRKKCAAAGRASRGIAKRTASRRAPFVGVTFHTRRGTVLSKPWRAQMKIDRKQTHLGYFATAEEAARAYDRKAREVGCLNLNFP